MDLCCGNMFIFYWRSWPFTSSTPNSMVRLPEKEANMSFLTCRQGFSSIRNTSVLILSMIPMKGTCTLNLVLRNQAECLFRYETISDLMSLQDQIDKFQKLIFSHFRSGANNETRISALVPLVQESYGIYKFVTSMLRAMHASMWSACRT